MDNPDKPYVIVAFRYPKDCALFWRPEDMGYTSNLEQAGRYTLEEALNRCKMPDNGAVLYADAVKHAHMHVDPGLLRAHVLPKPVKRQKS